MSKYTIQDIFKLYGGEYIKNHNLSKEQWKVFNDIRNCDIKELGYHICTCENCGEEYFGFNSCRNRHCPMCQNYAREKWIQKEVGYLLDSKYFHIVTTISYELNEMFLYNQRICYNILFKATSESILELCEDSKWLGAKLALLLFFILGDKLWSSNFIFILLSLAVFKKTTLGFLVIKIIYLSSSVWFFI